MYVALKNLVTSQTLTLQQRQQALKSLKLIAEKSYTIGLAFGAESLATLLEFKSILLTPGHASLNY